MPDLHWLANTLKLTGPAITTILNILRHLDAARGQDGDADRLDQRVHEPGFAETNVHERFLASSADPWLGTGQIGRSASAPSALRASSRGRWDLLRLLGYRAPPDGRL